MIVQCPACNSRYRIRDDNIPPSGGKIRCPSCGHSFVVYPANATGAEDSTSITDRNALNSLVNNMSGQQNEDHQATEIVGGDDLDALRGMQQGMDDGTVEIKNPMEYWQNLQNIEVDEKVGAPSSAYAGSGENEGEYDAAPTEIVSPDNLNLPFSPGGGNKPSIPAPTGKTKPTLPTPSFHPSGNQEKPGGPSISPPNTGQKSGPSIPPPRPTQNTPESAPQTEPAFNPGNQGQEDPFAQPDTGNQQEPVRQQVAADHQGQAIGTADTMAPGQMHNLGGADDPFRPSGASSEDIMAAIEEASQAHIEDEPMGAYGVGDSGSQAAPDPNHDGPWKLKTNFGLTYEFPDNRSLNNWLSSRDELDGYALSGDGTNFFALTEFPQIAGSGAGPSQSIASSGLNAQPQNLPAMPGSDGSGEGRPPGAPQPATGFGQTPPPGGFTPPASRGLGSGRFQPLPENPGAPQPGAPVSNEFQPPSREAKYNGLLWFIFLLLLAICIVVGLQTFGVVNFMAMLGMEEKKTQPLKPTPRNQPQPTQVPSTVGSDSDDQDVERLLKEARREVRENRLQSALDRIKTVQMLEPDNVEALEISIDAYGKLGQEEKVEELEAKVAELKGAAAGPDAGAAEENPEESE